MKLFTQDQLKQLLDNGTNRDCDHKPVVKLHTPGGKCVWLLTEADPEEPDMAFGLCDLGLGFPELGYVYLPEIITVCRNLGLKLECDPEFTAQHPISVYAQKARIHQRIIADPDVSGQTPPSGSTPTHGV